MHDNKCQYTLCSEKPPTHVFFYISVENVKIYRKFSGYVLRVIVYSRDIEIKYSLLPVT